MLWDSCTSSLKEIAESELDYHVLFLVNLHQVHKTYFKKVEDLNLGNADRDFAAGQIL